MTTIFVCDDQKAKYSQGICAKPNEQRRAEFSLWFAYAVDVASDLAVMFLPFRMTWSLQMPRTKKLGVFVLFGSGWVCIVSASRISSSIRSSTNNFKLFATLRVVQVGVEDGVPKVPDPKWLQIWTIIETSMGISRSALPPKILPTNIQSAVIIGCSPAFAAVLHKQFGQHAASYYSRGSAGRPVEEIKIASVGSSSAPGSKSGDSDRPKGREDMLWSISNGSEEALAEEEPPSLPKKHRGTRMRR